MKTEAYYVTKTS